jgi:hypothetical protein
MNSFFECVELKRNKKRVSSKKISLIMDEDIPNNYQGLDIRESIYLASIDAETPPKCHCGNNLKFYNGGYSETCSINCRKYNFGSSANDRRREKKLKKFEENFQHCIHLYENTDMRLDDICKIGSSLFGDYVQKTYTNEYIYLKDSKD